MPRGPGLSDSTRVVPTHCCDITLFGSTQKVSSVIFWDMLGKRSLRAGLLIGWLGAGALGGCGSAAAPPPKAAAPPELSGLAEERKSKQQEWAAKEAGIRDRCEISDGDCMMQVRDQRFELLSSQSFPECDVKSGAERELCEENGAVDRGMGKEIAGLYEFHNNCMTQMLECTVKLEAEAVEKLKVARAETREATILALGKSESAHVEAVAAREGVAYLRSTLPPSEEGACANLEAVTTCLASNESKQAELTEELRKEDGDYNETYAATVYQDANLAEAQCYTPEFQCLKDRAKRHGGSPETDRALKKNLEMLKQRERLSLRVSSETAANCKNTRVTKHQQSIISAYTTYNRQPVLFFLKKLHQAFYAMHEDQVACLRSLADTAPARPAPAPAAPPPSKPAKDPAPEPGDTKDSLLQAKR